MSKNGLHGDVCREYTKRNLLIPRVITHEGSSLRCAAFLASADAHHTVTLCYFPDSLLHTHFVATVSSFGFVGCISGQIENLMCLKGELKV